MQMRTDAFLPSTSATSPPASSDGSLRFQFAATADQVRWSNPLRVQLHCTSLGFQKYFVRVRWGTALVLDTTRTVARAPGGTRVAPVPRTGTSAAVDLMVDNDTQSKKM